LSVPKKAVSAATTAVLWQACADGYSWKFGVAASGFQITRAGVQVEVDLPLPRLRAAAA
jgi:hypothetical protein